MADEKKVRTRRAKLGLTREMIVRAALSIVEAQGLSALSARRLANMLGCEAMSLYYHFPNMDALLDAIVDDLLTDQRVETTSVQSIATDLTDAALVYLGIADRHPHAFQLIATRRWRTPNALAAVKSMVDAFVNAGFTMEQALGKARILAAYLNGAGLALSAWRKAGDVSIGEVADALPGMESATLQSATIRSNLVAGLEILVRDLVMER
ncbi:TetR/AcrR family transcriptional regulator [Sphingomonas sp. SUN039]|uniref:TetR/AcrR family transcriptional regulator n=1 Tax=Sphingomonas sp. SUN039 TaxID=2937787 RepID=UPI0021646B7E|nr:TetR/AcrR family transcriptional regulator [Sphingomonas sp. SUN039]UVO55481.1 TetR family transcriptional regulator [Sphingomonas sp. SUN039]